MSSRIIRATSVESKGIVCLQLSHAALLNETPEAALSHTGSSVLSSVSGDSAYSPKDQESRLQTAEEQAESLVRQAKVEASEIEKQAYERGFSEGEKAGRELGEKALEALLKQYAKTLEELNNLRKEIFAASEGEVVRLALEIARKVIRREVSADEELVLTLVKVALSRLADQTVMTVRVNPADYQTIQRHHHAHSSSSSLAEGVKLVDDPSVSRGGCLIETESGIIDARIEEQLREIEKGFLE
jgi:flagellar assembly protein FliH